VFLDPLNNIDMALIFGWRAIRHSLSFVWNDHRFVAASVKRLRQCLQIDPGAVR